MLVAVMQVRQVRMAVRHRRVLVPVRVGLGALVAVMRVLVMRVMDVPVAVRQVLVRVRVLVALGEHQPRCGEHQRQGDPERDRDRLPETEDRDRRADEGRGAEVRSGAGGSKVP